MTQKQRHDNRFATKQLPAIEQWDQLLLCLFFLSYKVGVVN